MKLTELGPSFAIDGGPGSYRLGKPVPLTEGVGLFCRCPCGCGARLYVPFENPIGPGPLVKQRGWKRTGETFETLTLEPSIWRRAGCGWHGFIRNGEIITV